MPQKKSKIINIPRDYDPENVTHKAKKNISKKRSSPKKSPRKKSPDKKIPKKYSKLSSSVFCGHEGGYDIPGKFPVNSAARCSNALSRAHLAPNPDGIRKCALRKARENNWSNCGSSSKYIKKNIEK